MKPPKLSSVNDSGALMIAAACSGAKLNLPVMRRLGRTGLR